MVRETRFAFDQNFPHHHAAPPEDFTEEDDLFLDAFSAPTAREKSDKTRRQRARPKKTKSERASKPSSDPNSQNSAADRRGHLADADWLKSPKSSKTTSRRKSA